MSAGLDAQGYGLWRQEWMANVRPGAKPTAADRKALIAQIEQAFAAVPYPGDDWICPGVTAEARRFGTEEAEIEAAFRGLHWGDVPLEVLNRHQSALSFFSPAACRFYLPAYLLTVLGVPRRPPDFVEIGGGITSAVLHSLQPPVEMSWKPRSHPTVAWFLERVNGFTPEQQQAIRAFLHHVGGREARAALNRYWEPRG
jgi:hypothetical protein